MSNRTQLQITWIEKETGQSWSLCFSPPGTISTAAASTDAVRRKFSILVGDAKLIAEIEGKLQQRVSQKMLFSIRWSLA